MPTTVTATGLMEDFVPPDADATATDDLFAGDPSLELQTVTYVLIETQPRHPVRVTAGAARITPLFLAHQDCILHGSWDMADLRNFATTLSPREAAPLLIYRAPLWHRDPFHGDHTPHRTRHRVVRRGATRAVPRACAACSPPCSPAGPRCSRPAWSTPTDCATPSARSRRGAVRRGVSLQVAGGHQPGHRGGRIPVLSHSVAAGTGAARLASMWCRYRPCAASRTSA